MRDRERRWAALLADKRMRDDVWLAKMTTQPKGLRWPLLDDPDRP